MNTRGDRGLPHALPNALPNKNLFSYEGMYARAQLAIMNHNSGIDRVQSKRKDGKLRYITVFSEVASNCVAKKIMERKKKPAAYAGKHERQREST